MLGDNPYPGIVVDRNGVNWLEQLEPGEIVVLDGALATELERRGCDLRDDLWSAKLLLERPGLIADVHTSYLLAGADIITTASYQATFQGFAKRGVSHAQAAELLTDSVRIAISARDRFWANAEPSAARRKPLIAASIGSYGAYLADGSEFSGSWDVDEAELEDFHLERLILLASSDADVLACETIPSLVEARALSRLLLEHPSARAWISFSCRDAHHTNHGERIADCARELEQNPRIVALGVNCTHPRWIESLVRDIASVSNKPIVVYPNSGETWDAHARVWTHDETPLDFAREATRWIGAGARIVGGCCRTTPNDVLRLRALASASNTTAREHSSE